MEKRHTDKRNFEDTALSESEIQQLAAPDPSAIFYYARESEGGAYIASGALHAMEKQSEQQNKRDELAQWLRFSNGETQESRDGLPAEQLGIQGLKKSFYYLFTNRDAAKKDAYAKQGNDMTKGQLENCTGFFVVTGEHTKRGWIQAGMTLEEFWLKAAQQEVAVHTMSQILEETPYCDEIQTKLEKDQPIQMVLRVGKITPYGANAKIRRELSDFATVTFSEEE